MDKDIKKESKFVDNVAYKERWQFQVWVDENIICQRYFKINGFNKDALKTLAFTEVMDESVDLIKNDLVPKSRVAMWYTRDSSIKMTGFLKDLEGIEEGDLHKLMDEEYGDVVELRTPYPQTVKKSYFRYAEGTPNVYADEEAMNPYDVTFKFVFLIDDKPLYEHIWDGTVYPKYVRNGVDLSNSDASYRDKDPVSLPFGISVVRSMTYGKVDLIYQIIRNICEVLSEEPDNDAIRRVEYGDRKYLLSSYNKDYVNKARQDFAEKTRKYESWIRNWEKYPESYGLTPAQWEFIEDRY